MITTLKKIKQAVFNIFSSHAPHDSIKRAECNFMNLYCTQSCAVEIGVNGDIIKYFFNKQVYDWECRVYLNFIDRNIFPLMEARCDTNVIIYHTKHLISLRTFLLNCKSNVLCVQVLYELFSFVNTFSTLGFVHGNLHIDNIFIDVANANANANATVMTGVIADIKEPVFVVVDLSNAYVINDTSMSCPFHRKSFIGPPNVDDNNSSNVLDIWDLLTLYVSLRTFFKKERKIACLSRLCSLIYSYIPIDTLKSIDTIIYR